MPSSGSDTDHYVVITRLQHFILERYRKKIPRSGKLVEKKKKDLASDV
jgi:hypothetical protein